MANIAILHFREEKKLRETERLSEVRLPNFKFKNCPLITNNTVSIVTRLFRQFNAK